MEHFSKKVLTWFDSFGRKNLPWQKNISPYSVWISEIMLQQTQVTTVIPYFERFMSIFPSLEILAHSTLDSVLHTWTGLGYYARARNIYKTANIIHHDLQGIFPDDLEGLVSLPGIGKSTAGAILSIAFHIPSAILDGNVRRVLARYHAVPGQPGDKNFEKILWSFAEKYTPNKRCADYTQAIMDLGATICTKATPNCAACPLNSSCTAFQQELTSKFPNPKKKNNLSIKSTQFLILKNKENQVLLEKRPLIGIWGGLWNFPETSEEDIVQYCSQKFGLKIISKTEGPEFRHTFSHFHLDIKPIYLSVELDHWLVMESEFLWCHPSKIPQIGLAAPTQKLLTAEQESPEG